MDAKHILARNFAAFMLQTDDPVVVLSTTEQLDKMIAQDLKKVLEGPFGTVDMESCACKAWDGYFQAIDELIEAIQLRPIPHPNDKRAVTMEREELIELLRIARLQATRSRG